MGLGRKIGIGIGIAVVALFALGAIGYYYSGNIDESLTTEGQSGDQIATNLDSQPTGQANLAQDDDSDSEQALASASVVTKDLQDIMPARDDIGTRWRIGTQSNSTDDLEDVKGVIQALQQTYSTSKDGFNHIAAVALVKFDTPQNADAFYNARISQVYDEGGYEEYGVSASSDAKCYGTFISLSTTDRINIYCLESNIYYRVQAFASPIFLDEIQSDVDAFPKIIAGKI